MSFVSIILLLVAVLVIVAIFRAVRIVKPVSYTHLTLPTTPYV